MRTPSKRCFPHLVAITRNIWGVDDDGGPRVEGQSTTSGHSAFVQPGKARTVVETSDDAGLRRITEIEPSNVYFDRDVGLRPRDVITWVDSSGVRHSYTVLGYQQPCGASSVWTAQCEESS